MATDVAERATVPVVTALPPTGGVRFRSAAVTEDVLFATGRGIAPWMASVTFGGSDLKTVYIGSLKGQNIPYFRVPVAGLPMVHWHETRPVRI